MTRTPVRPNHRQSPDAAPNEPTTVAPTRDAEMEDLARYRRATNYLAAAQITCKTTSA